MFYSKIKNSYTELRNTIIIHVGLIITDIQLFLVIDQPPTGLRFCHGLSIKYNHLNICITGVLETFLN